MASIVVLVVPHGHVQWRADIVFRCSIVWEGRCRGDMMTWSAEPPPAQRELSRGARQHRRRRRAMRRAYAVSRINRLGCARPKITEARVAEEVR